MPTIITREIPSHHTKALQDDYLAAQDDLTTLRRHTQAALNSHRLTDTEWDNLQAELSFAMYRVEEAQRALEGEE